jgi:hypothetical protein
MSAGLIRLSGLAAMAGGVLWPLWAGVVQSVGWGEPGSAAYERYELINRLLPLALLPVVLGFVGLHIAQRRSYGWLGAAGFLTILAGFALILVGSVGEFWAFTEQGYALPNLRDASWTLFLLGHPILAVGTVLFGIGTARAQVFPGDVGMLFAVIGACGALIPFVGAFIFAIPFVWLGYLLWSGTVRQHSHVS